MKIYLDTVGCRLNQAEIEPSPASSASPGIPWSPAPEDADLAVVNTCAVTAAAASDSRHKLRQAARQGAGEVIATGCWATP